ncbi:MAG: peptide chain release factor-like protein [Anaerohalosphaera sp.]|nr:peptide chain release factor-like protein [Anaerohalosphaera sp.]
MIRFGVTAKKADALFERMKRCGIDDCDLDEEFVRSSGPGGQKVNKTSTCAVLKHKPTGIIVKMGKERSQQLNRYYARKRLCELIEEQQLGKQSPAAIAAEKIRKQKQRRKRRTSS